MKIEIYSDVMCPWCYIGERRLQRALAGFPGGEGVEVVFRPFQLDPAAPERPVPMPEYLRRKFGAGSEGAQARVAAVAAGEGIRMDFGRGVVVNTLAAHRLLALAEHEGGPAVQRMLAGKLFEAHFERGGDLSDPDQLAALAGEAGMDPARAAAYLASGAGVEETREALRAGVERGVRAVPTFVFDGRYVVEGAQDPSVFLAVLRKLHVPAPAGEACGDDGCARG